MYYELTNHDVKVWFDEFSLEIGDGLIDKINEGIKNSDYGIIVLSKPFMKNFGWHHEEYKMFKTSEIIKKKKLILPIWRSDISSDDVANYSLDLVDKLVGKELMVLKILLKKLQKL